MIAGYVNDASPLSPDAEELLNDIVVRLWPVNAPAQCPHIDQIANHIEGLEFVRAEECNKASARLPRVPRWTSEIQPVRYCFISDD